MPIYDYKCAMCGREEERVENINTESVPCSCGGTMTRLFSVGRCFIPNEDSPWIRSVTDVVDKDNPAPHVREFLTHPTRRNYREWMAKEKLRPLDPGEKPRRSETPARDPRFIDQIAKKRFERQSLGEVR